MTEGRRPGPAGERETETTGDLPAGAPPIPTIKLVRPYRVRFDEATADETVRTAVYLAWFADCAWQHSTVLGFDRPWYAERRLFWLVRALQLEVLRPVATYSEVTVSTRVVGFRRVTARRESEVRDASGDLVARGEIDWVMTNERGVPVRVPFGFHELFGAEPGGFEMHRVNLPEPPPDAIERRFGVRRRDLDPLDHVNNSVYVDYLEESLAASPAAAMLHAFPRRYVLEYAAAAGRANRLVSRAWPNGTGWAYRLDRDDGANLLRARLEA